MVTLTITVSALVVRPIRKSPAGGTYNSKSMSHVLTSCTTLQSTGVEYV